MQIQTESFGFLDPKDSTIRLHLVIAKGRGALKIYHEVYRT